MKPRIVVALSAWLFFWAKSAKAAVVGLAASGAVAPSSLATLPPMPSAPPYTFAAPPEMSVWPYLFQLALFTIALAAVAFYGLRFLRDKFPALQIGLGIGSSVGLKVVDRVAIDAKRSVFVVSLGKRAWLLASTDQHVTTVAELGPEDLTGEFEAIVEKENTRRDPL